MGHFSKDKLDALQNEACEMLRKNPGLSFCAISKQLGLGDNTVRRWYRNDLNGFQNKWDEALKDAFHRLEGLAIQCMGDLIVDGNFQAAKYVLDNRGYKPVDKVEAKVDATQDINIVIGD